MIRLQAEARIGVTLTLLALTCVANADPATDTAAAPAGQLEEIVITARKQSESILTVPVTASTLSAADLARTGTADISSVAEQMPSVRFDNSAAAGGSYTIRGIGSSVIDSGSEQSVATVLDGIQTSRGEFINLGLLDLAQVEVLKGPQALFFGKNSPAGVLALTSNGPTDKLEGYIKVADEFVAHEKIIEAAASGPLTDTLRARVAIRYSDLGGWLENTAVPAANPFAAIPGNSPTIGPAAFTTNSATNLVGRLTVDYKPTSDFTATLRALGSRVRDNGPNGNSEVSNCGGAAHPDFEGIPDTAGDCTINSRVAVGPTPPQLLTSNSLYNSKPYGDFNSDLTSLTLDYSAGPIQLTSVTGYLSYDWDFLQVYPTTFAYPDAAVAETFNQLSQEVRAVSHYDFPVNFSGGVYYETSKSNTFEPDAIFPVPADPATGKFENFDYNSKIKSSTYSAFAQARWKFAPQLELDAGARYSRDPRENELYNSFVNTNSPLPVTPAGDILSGSKTFTDFSPEVTLNWTPVNDTLIYGSYRTGFKAGAATSPLILTGGFNSATDLFYQPEKIKGGEIGLKTLQLDNRLRITAAAYLYQYNDLQISNFDAATFTVEPLAGDVRTSGFETEAAFKVFPDLTLSAGIGYVHAKYTKFTGVACYGGQTAATGCIDGTENLTGQQKFRSPDWTGNLGLVYETPAFDRLIFGADGGVYFSSKFFTEEDNSPYAVQGAYEMYNAGMHLKTENDRWQVALIGRNLGDKRIVESSYALPDSTKTGSIFGTPNRPREVILELTARYR